MKPRRRTTARTGPRRAFTLAELVVSVALVSIVGAALMSGFLLSLRAVPEPGDPGLAAGELDGALEFILADASVAQQIGVSGDNKLVVQVADITGDDAPDRVSYELEDDTADSTSLLRVVNNGSPRTLVTGVASCQFVLHETLGTDTRITVTVKLATGRVHRAGVELVTRPADG